MRKAFLLTFLLPLSVAVFAQKVIEGTISGEKKGPLSNVSVSVSKSNMSGILAFSISDNKGYYKITTLSSDDSLIISVSLLGYAPIKQKIKNETQSYDFVLQESAVILKDVSVKNAPVRLGKDTLNYSVQSFATKEDRSIADVIRKMPGMEVQDDGTIIYQGKSIQAFLVNGLDLLEGKYGLASNNLPYDAVKNVQVIENDQRIKVLDSLVYSDRTTLNIQLKKYLTTGTGQLGIGTEPLLWDVNLTPITFNKTFQAINSYQSNNIGKDKSAQLKTLTTDYILDPVRKPNTQLLNVLPVAQPPFDPIYWLDNNQHVLSSNILKVLSKAIQIKMDFAYVNDLLHREGSTQTTIFSPGQNIQLAETKSNSVNRNLLKTGFVLEKNTKRQFIKNVFQFEKETSRTIGELFNNKPASIRQQLQDEPLSVSNRMSMIVPISKQLLTISSQISHIVSTQMFSTSPGVFDSLLNNNHSYDATYQHLVIKQSQASHYLGIVKAAGRFTFSPKLGLEYTHQKLESHIATEDLGILSDAGNNFRNNTRFNKLNIFQELLSQYKIGSFVSSLRLRLSEQQYSLFPSTGNNKNFTQRVLFEPQFNSQVKLGIRWELNMFGSLNRYFGEINQLYSAYILQSYRTLQKLNPTLPENTSYTGGFMFKYKLPKRAFFFTVGYNYNSTQKNLIYNNYYSPDGSSTLEMLLRNNYQRMHTVNGTMSKYVEPVKTLFSFNGRIQTGYSEQIVNNVVNQINMQQYGFGFGFNNSILDHLVLGYNASLNISNNSLNGTRINNITIQEHKVSASYFPAASHMISYNANFYQNNQQSQTNQAFVNMVYRYAIQKKKIDFEVQCSNLFNANNFTTNFSDGFIIVENQIKMRPRQLLALVRFSF